MQTLIGLLNCLFIFAIVFFWNKRREKSPLDRFFFPALLIKAIAGIGVGLLYSLYYPGGDTFNYFYAASRLADLAYSAPAEYLMYIWNSQGSVIEGLSYGDNPRALLMTKLVSLPAVITAKNYWISSLYFSLFSFYGMWTLAHALEKQSPSSSNVSAVAFLFIPSVVLWTSGILKESIALGCIGYIAATFLNAYFFKKRSLTGLFITLLYTILLWKIKFYYAAILLPLLAVGLVLKSVNGKSNFVRRSFLIQGVVGITVLFLLYILAAQVYPPLSVQFIVNQLVFNHDLYYTTYTSVAENMIHYRNLQPDISSIMVNLPAALFAGMYRPLIFDGNHLLQYLVGFENTLLLLLSVIAIWHIFKVATGEGRLLLILSLLYILTLASLMALATPNFGTLMRYKMGFLPFFYYLVIKGNLKWLAGFLKLRR